MSPCTWTIAALVEQGGLPRVIVDGEWYVDYTTMNAPFDLL